MLICIWSERLTEVNIFWSRAKAVLLVAHFIKICEIWLIFWALIKNVHSRHVFRCSNYLICELFTTSFHQKNQSQIPNFWLVKAVLILFLYLLLNCNQVYWQLFWGENSEFGDQFFCESMWWSVFSKVRKSQKGLLLSLIFQKWNNESIFLIPALASKNWLPKPNR